MRLKFVAAAIALAGALALVAAPADAQTNQTKKGTVAYNRDRTVVVTRDEDGVPARASSSKSGPISIPARKLFRANASAIRAISKIRTSTPEA